MRGGSKEENRDNMRTNHVKGGLFKSLTAYSFGEAEGKHSLPYIAGVDVKQYPTYRKEFSNI